MKKARTEAKSSSSNLPAAEMVAFDDELRYADEEVPAAAAPLVPREAQPSNQNRVTYTVQDNAQYYEIASMIVMIHAHVKEGWPVSSLFLPHEDTSPDYDF